MLAYRYNHENEFVGTVEVQKDYVASRRLGRDVYAIPTNATMEEPLQPKEGYAIVFNEDKWEYVKDYRGQMVFNLATREGLIWEKIGELPKGYGFNLPERLEDLKDTYLKTMKTNFDVYLSKTKITVPVQNLCFTYSSLERLQNEQATGILMSRDDNNTIYTMTQDEYATVIKFLVVYGQHMYLQKWLIENALKKCTDLELLKTYKKSLEFKADMKQLDNIMKLPEDKLQAYFKRLADSIK